jgi:NADPH-dependent curcumin reductase CurA
MPVSTQNSRLVLAERPQRGPITSRTFRLESVDLPSLQDGEVLVRVEHVSIVWPHPLPLHQKRLIASGSNYAELAE